ncbi:hypothetical protein GW17_00048719 [Ensete ventricosum]|nr:hypothetical protein GW17_00048719 [Ensete ventricosum]RZS10305.1 hypothetical protein BHM03_00041516 [Ensete ventricosum]
MKFGQTFTEYLHGEQEAFLNKCSHVEYKRLKKFLKSCRVCRASNESDGGGNERREEGKVMSELCRCNSCACILRFPTYSRVRHLLNLHVSSGLYRYMLRLRRCFMDDQQRADYTISELLVLTTYGLCPSQIHGSADGRKFKSRMRTEHIELLQSPWLIELGAFYLNFSVSDFGEPGEFFHKFSCDLNDMQPVMTMTLSDSMKYEYSLVCAICLVRLFFHLFRKCG